MIGCLQDLAAHVIQAFEALDTQPPFEELLGEWPPRPMFDGNGVGKRDVCMAEEALHGLAVKTQVCSDGMITSRTQADVRVLSSTSSETS